MQFLREFGILVVAYFAAYIPTWLVLRRLKARGIWTVSVGFVFLVLFSFVQRSLTHGNGDSPEGRGIALGCAMASLWWLFKHKGWLVPNKW